MQWRCDDVTPWFCDAAFISLFQRRSGSNKGDVQILSLDGDSRRGETFRREGDAEILELERQENSDDDGDDRDEMEVTSLNGDDDNQRRR